MIYGTGHWDITDYLSDQLVMAYREPEVLRLPVEPSDCPHIRDPPEKVADLAKLLDAKGLLLLHQERVDSRHPGELVKVFNTFKRVDADRQIGDRRGRNSVECRVEGPSHNLPSALDVFDLFASPARHQIFISITDRKDFYHQIWTTKSRALSNTLGPGIPWSMVRDTDAFSVFLLDSARTKYDRAKHGDLLSSRRRCPRKPDELMWVSFKSVLQGDHAGVDLATEAHSQLLQSVGLLKEDSRVVAQRPLSHACVAEGLCIDDYFVVSVEEKGTRPCDSKAWKMYESAQSCYRSTGLLGSPEKDVRAQTEGKAIGAKINGSDRARDLGLFTVSAPPEKRYSLSFLTLQLVGLPYTTDVLHLCLIGAWVSMLMFRRPLMSILRHSFHLVDACSVDAANPKLVRLTRAVAEELTLLAVLAPLAQSEISAPFSEKLFCTDASLDKGAICEATCTVSLSRALWRICKSKGSYSRLQSPAEVLFDRLGIESGEIFEKATVCAKRPLAFKFDFIEVFSGASCITEFVEKLGFSVGPPIDISFSPEFNLEFSHVMAWLSHLVVSGSLLGFFVSPPCTTYSVMRRPPLRSRELPYGFEPHHPQTHVGNVLGLRGFQLLDLGERYEVPGVLETPFSSMLKLLRPHENLKRKPAFDECRTDSCRFGSVHQKGFRFMGVHVDLSLLRKRCRCRSPHVVVEGKYTKASAIYTRELSWAIACTLAVAMAVKREVAFDDLDLPVKGLENQLVNEVMSASSWRTVQSWNFRKKSHINILELASLLRLVTMLAREQPRSRVVAMVDSFVTRCSVSKGRTASLAMTPVIKKICSVCVASGLFLTLPYVPSRLNVSDDPTRDAPLRSAIRGIDLSDFSEKEIYQLGSLPTTKKWASNWVRLMLILIGPGSLGWNDSSVFRVTRRRGLSRIARQLDFSGMDFDQTCGYPGEGPWTFGFFSLLLLSDFGWISFAWLPCFLFLGLAISFSPRACFGFWTFGCSVLALCCSSTSALAGPQVVVFFGGGSFDGIGLRVAMAMPLFPRNAGDWSRIAARAARPVLRAARPTLPVTDSLRQRYLEVFYAWLAESDIDFELLLIDHSQRVQEINDVLTRFGKELYECGRPYAHYVETINAVVARKPVLRRQLQQAWDLAFNWVKLEPSSHHVAMPFQVLLAMVSTSLLWGWTRMAGCLALAWGAFLRAGELLATKRADLLLPCDVLQSIDFALVTIAEPKTRLTAARHQAAKLEIPDLLRLVHICFSRLKPSEPLWDQSPQTFRKRFKQLLRALSLPTEKLGSLKPLDIGSLRSGGATWTLQVSEDAERVRRQGRWVNTKSMEIYIQESMALLYLKLVPPLGLQKVMTLAFQFEPLLEQAEKLTEMNFPPTVWWSLLSQ